MMKNESDSNKNRNMNVVRPHQDLVITKWIGLKATCILAEKREDELLKIFPPVFLQTARQFDRYLSVDSENKIATDLEASAVYEICEGGILAALWKLALEGNVGITVNLRAIPIRQETVEICECFDANPYRILSEGSLLIALDDGNELVSALMDQGIYAVIAGRTTAGKDKILKNGKEISYLNRPEFHELDRALTKISSVERNRIWHI